MRNKYFWLSSIVVILGIMGLVLSILSSKNCYLAEYNLGDAGTWFSGIFTALAVIVAFFEISESRKSFEREHSSSLKLFTTYHLILGEDASDENKTQNDNVIVETLQITPLNNGLSTGTYRFLGVCKTRDKLFMQKVLKKTRLGSVTREEIFKFDIKIYTYNQVDKLDVDGTTLLYPTTNRVFETIKAGEVGKIQNLDVVKILKKLKVDKNNRSTRLSIIYVDSLLNSYVVDAGAPKDSDDPNVPVSIIG